MRKNKTKHGFTLLELSIVLVIIGLIIGGITVGADLIRAAELNTVTSDYTKYKVAVNSFRLKYNALPGDLNNATAYWGAADANPTTCLTATGTGTQTCDGNGDGAISPIGSASARVESFMFWQHLSNAEILAGSYTGISGSGQSNGGHTIVGTNSPASSLANAGWHSHTTVHGYSALYFASWAGSQHVWLFGGNRANSRPMDPVFTNAELFSIDQKIDDGVPTDGTVQALFSIGCTDAAAKTDITGTVYNLANEDVACAMLFLNPI